MFTNIRRRDHEFHDESPYVYVISTWSINVLLQIARVVMQLAYIMVTQLACIDVYFVFSQTEKEKLIKKLSVDTYV